MRRGYDYVLIARAGTVQRRFAELIKDLERALAKVHAPAPAKAGSNTDPILPHLSSALCGCDAALEQKAPWTRITATSSWPSCSRWPCCSPGSSFFLPPPKPPETAEQQQQTEPGPPRPAGEARGTAGAPQPGAPGAATLTRHEALAASPRIAIDTPALKGSISLKGGRIDDLTLKDYRETVEPNSPNVILLSPAGGPGAYYAEHGFVAGAGA